MTPMKRLALVGWVFSLGFLLAACQSDASNRKGAGLGSRPSAGSEVSGAIRKLGELDYRRPVPLQPMMAWHQKQNMMRHLEAIQKILGGLAAKNWEQVAKASSWIESSKAMQSMCQRMGKGAPGFTEMALEFHRRADAIGKAARAQDVTGVLRTTSNTLEACTACHATFRQEVVDAAAWRRRKNTN